MMNEFGLELLGRTTGTSVAFVGSSFTMDQLHDVNKPLPAGWPPEKIRQATLLVEQGFAVSGSGWFYGLTLKGFEALSAEHPGSVHEGLRLRMKNWRKIVEISSISAGLEISYEEYGNAGFKLVLTGARTPLAKVLPKLAAEGFNVRGWKIGTPVFYERYPVDLYR